MDYVISSGVTSVGLVMSRGDTLVVDGGGVASATTDNDATETALSGGSIIGSVLSGDATQIVEAGGAASLTTLEDGSFAQDYGSETSAYVGENTTLVVAAGGVASATIVNNGMLLVSGGAVSATTIVGGFEDIVLGSDTGASIQLDGLQLVEGAGIATGAVVSSGGYQRVGAGGIAFTTTVSSGGTLNVFAGGSASDATALAGGRVFVSAGSVSDTVLSGGSLTTVAAGSAFRTQVSFGGQEITSSGGVSSDASVLSGGTASVGFGGSATAAFVGSGGQLQVASGASVSNTTLDASDAGIQIAVDGSVGAVFGYTFADELTVSGSAYDAADTATMGDDNLLVIKQADGGEESLQFDPMQDFEGDTFSVVASPNAGVLDIVESVACFCAGATVLTDTGYRRVEDLAAGDLVVTVDGACEPIVWIGRRSYSARALAGRRHQQPVRIRRGALADNIPTHDLLVSPLHALLLDGVLIPAWLLINGRDIVQEEPVGEVRYFHIELAKHAALLANGAAAESFAEDNNRAMFDNAADAPQETRLQLPTDMVSFAPRVIDGQTLEMVRRRLSTRATLQTVAA